MDLVNRAQLEVLAGWQRSPTVSIYMPVHRIGAASEQDPLRLKNLLRQAETALEKRMRRPEAVQLIEQAWRLQQDSHFWLYHSTDGLALFAAPGFFRHYRVPWRFKERCVVADRFDIKPLIQYLFHEGRFYLLALSQNAVRLFHGTHAEMSEVPLPAGVPRSLADQLAREGTEIERSVQHHTAVEGGTTVGIMHGQGRPKDSQQKLSEEYVQRVSSGVEKLLKEESVPLVLAAVKRLQSVFREKYSLPHLLPDGVTGSPDAMDEKELHDRAWQVVEPKLEERYHKALEHYQRMRGTPRTSVELEQVVPAADQGRVETLFATNAVEVWGAYDPARGQVVVHDAKQSGDIDLSNFAVERTLLNKGDTFVVSPERVPGGATHAAIFRW